MVTGEFVGLAVVTVGNGPLVTSLPDRDMSEQALHICICIREITYLEQTNLMGFYLFSM